MKSKSSRAMPEISGFFFKRAFVVGLLLAAWAFWAHGFFAAFLAFFVALVLVFLAQHSLLMLCMTKGWLRSYLDNTL